MDSNEKLIDLWDEKRLEPKELEAHKPERDMLAEVRNSFGWSDRTLNQKRAVRNRFLPCSSITWEKTIASWSWVELDILTSEIIEWGSKRRIEWGNKIYPPEAWTYMFTWYTTASWTITPPITTVRPVLSVWRLNWWASVVIWYWVVNNLIVLSSLNWVVKLEKDDYIDFLTVNWYTWSLDVSLRVEITKIS